MADEFVNLLSDKEKSKTFELHKMERDSEGKEKYMRVNKDDIA